MFALTASYAITLDVTNSDQDYIKARRKLIAFCNGRAAAGWFNGCARPLSTAN